MKTLFYNSIELPAEVHIVSECFGIDITYEPMGDPDHPAWMSELFNLAKCDSFEEVAVRLTKHNEGYTRKSKFAEREEVNGWISLKEVKNGEGPHPIKTPKGWLHLGGGYLKDKALLLEEK